MPNLGKKTTIPLKKIIFRQTDGTRDSVYTSHEQDKCIAQFSLLLCLWYFICFIMIYSFYFIKIVWFWGHTY